MKNSIIFLYFLFLWTSVLAQTESLFKSFDNKIYNPKELGLNSLSVDAKVKGLTETLKATLIVPNISNVFFRITWDPKKQFNVKVIGLPPGFNEIKNSLELTMVDKLRYFIPPKIINLVKDYSLSTKKLDSGIQYTLEDKTFLKGITKIDAFFDRDNNLSKMEFKGLNIWEMNTFKYEELSGTKKLVIKNFLVESGGPQVVYATSYSVDYTNVGKFFFPKTISITAQVQTLPGEKGSKQTLAESKSEITFSNFQVK